jgi:hypothetical protein
MDEFTNYTEDDWSSWWTEVFYGVENDDIIHVCAQGETIRCVDCAKDVSCWNNNGLYLLCTDCLAIESTLEMNQVQGDEDSPYAHLSEEEKKEKFLEMYRENPEMFDF